MTRTGCGMGKVWALAGLICWMTTACVEPPRAGIEPVQERILEPVLEPSQPYSLEALPRCTVADLADTDSTSCGVLRPLPDEARHSVHIQGVHWTVAGGVLLREDGSGRVKAVAVVPRVWLGEWRGAVLLIGHDGRRWHLPARNR